VVNGWHRAAALAALVCAGAVGGCAKGEPPRSAAAAASRTGLVELRGAIEAGRVDEAEALVARLTEAERTSRSGRVLRGRVAELRGNGTEAKALYGDVLREEPGHLEASLALGARLLDEGDPAGSIATTDAALAAHPNDASLLLNRAFAVLTIEGFPAANEAFLAAERASAGSGVVRLSYASALARAGKTAEAIEVLVRVAGDGKSSIGELAEAGHELRQSGAFAQAMQAFERVVLQRDTGELRVERALCKIGLRDGDGALRELDRGIEIEPAYAPLYFYRGGRLAETRRWADAKLAYERYLQLAPNGPLAEMAKKRLRLVTATLER
jgi:tetratricopeptide (TPR) repeat protein